MGGPEEQHNMVQACPQLPPGQVLCYEAGNRSGFPQLATTEEAIVCDENSDSLSDSIKQKRLFGTKRT